MKKVLLLVFMFTLASAAGAAPLCQSDTLDVYLAQGYACQIGELTFSNFGYTPTGNPSDNALPASSVAVDVISRPGNMGFRFNGGWAVDGSGLMLDSLITFEVTGPVIRSLHLIFNGSAPSLTDPGTELTGSAHVTEQYCLGGSLTDGCQGGTIGQLHVTTSAGGTFARSAYFAPVTTLTLSKDINTSSGSDGWANISDVTNTFDYDVPEPISLLLAATGLIGLGFLRRRRK